MAPNLVTLIGLVVNMLGCTIFYFWDTKFDKDVEIPVWVYLFSVSCLFFYQTMDAIDGKQARRTGSSSPLGQLFDHGCDAF
jgi:ethanolaminephosphotransferase